MTRPPHLSVIGLASLDNRGERALRVPGVRSYVPLICRERERERIFCCRLSNDRRQCAVKYGRGRPRRRRAKPDVSSPQHRFGEDKRPRAQDRDCTESEISTFVRLRFKRRNIPRFFFATGCIVIIIYSRLRAMKCKIIVNKI